MSMNKNRMKRDINIFRSDSNKFIATSLPGVPVASAMCGISMCNYVSYIFTYVWVRVMYREKSMISKLPKQNQQTFQVQLN